jgi:membrane protease subunit HflC
VGAMNKRAWQIIGIIVAIILILSITYFVDEKNQVVILQMGKPVRTVQKPGLYLKLPWPIQSISVFDKRLLDYDAAPEDITTKDKKKLKLDNYAKWRIVDPLTFLQTLQTETGAQSRLDDIIYSELRAELGQHDLEEIVSVNRDTIMVIVTEKSNRKMMDYGIEVLDVRIKRADLPPENEKSIYDRMRAERYRIAKQYRSEGEEEALKIRAETDKEKAIIMAEAYRTSQIVRGEGEARAIEIYANAFKKDESFYDFYRTMLAYKETLKTRTTMVLPLETDFLKYLK